MRTLQPDTPDQEAMYSQMLGRNPWEAARQVKAKQQADAMVDELVKAGMVDPATAMKAKAGQGDSMDAVNRDPNFLNKVFK